MSAMPHIESINCDISDLQQSQQGRRERKRPNGKFSLKIGIVGHVLT